MLKLDLIDSAVYFDQLLRLYSDILKTKENRNLTISPAINIALTNKIISDFDNLSISNQNYSPSNKIDLTIYKLSFILTNLDLSNKLELRKFVIDGVRKHLYSNEIRTSAYYLIDVVVKLKDHIKVDLIKLLGHLVTIIDDSDDLLALNQLRDIDNATFIKFEEESQYEFLEMVTRVSNLLVENTSNDELEDNLWRLRQIESLFGYSLSEEIDTLEQRFEEYNQEQEVGEYDKEWGDYNNQRGEMSEKEIIGNLFGSYQ